MLRVESEKQGRYIESLDFVGYVLDDGSGVRFNDDVVTFDEMAMIVDYLRAKKNIKCLAYSRFICIFAFA